MNIKFDLYIEETQCQKANKAENNFFSRERPGEYRDCLNVQIKYFQGKFYLRLLSNKFSLEEYSMAVIWPNPLKKHNVTGKISDATCLGSDSVESRALPVTCCMPVPKLLRKVSNFLSVTQE